MEEGRTGRAHVVVLPFPSQGHINPMIQFSKRLAFNGLKVTIAATLSVTKFMQEEACRLVGIECFSEGCDEGGLPQAGNVDAYMEQLEVASFKSLSDLIEKHISSKFPVKCLIYDSLMPWALDIAKRLGLVGASFYTNSCAVNAIYHNLHYGLLNTPLEGPTVSMPGLPLLEAHELPSFVYKMESYPAYLHYLVNQFNNIYQADWHLFNTFDCLENEVVSWMAKQWPTRMLTIGPTVPSMYLDKRVEGDKGYGLNLFKPDSSSCMNWLETKEPGSVVYVSFGSLASLGDEEMGELAWGLRTSGNPFLWVVRATEEHKLPSKFAEEISEKSLVVNWCPQLDVLAHHAVGCFITHCGWNSTLEALSLGVPMVAMPQWTDQTTNAKFVEDIWRVGLRARPNDRGIVGREEIKKCIKEVVEGERGREMKRNAAKLRESAKEAVDEGGSSDKNIDNFLARLLCN